ncbi:MAG: transcriptional regulator NrdR [Gammaproteobacteria bacterium]|nr:MAG: transcriptional regulator NrdR [Gammaproteobacteria bacterium]
MRCPFCGADETRVVDSRLANEGDQVRRRRECLSCKDRFTTYESPELILPKVIKGNGNRELFDEDKLRSGMARALEKRPVKTEDVENSIVRIKHSLIVTGEREVKSDAIGKLVMEELGNLDIVAYIRFASVYSDFKDLSHFKDLIETLEKSPSIELKKHQIPLLPEEDSE